MDKKKRHKWRVLYENLKIDICTQCGAIRINTFASQYGIKTYYYDRGIEYFEERLEVEGDKTFWNDEKILLRKKKDE